MNTRPYLWNALGMARYEMALKSVATVEMPNGSHDMLLPARKKSLALFCRPATATPRTATPTR